jgi:toxin ParE1/3/4
VARVIWAPQALADLEAIGDFIAREAPRFAQMLTDGAFDVVERLELFPRSGRIVPEIGDDSMREILYHGYRIVYIVSGGGEQEEVKILTVFHSSMPFGVG